MISSQNPRRQFSNSLRSEGAHRKGACLEFAEGRGGVPVTRGRTTTGCGFSHGSGRSAAKCVRGERDFPFHQRVNQPSGRSQRELFKSRRLLTTVRSYLHLPPRFS